MTHYFDKQPTAAHERRVIEEEVRGVRLRFVTDRGVFSKGRLDFGSRLLLENLEIPPKANILDVGCGYGPIGLFAAKFAGDARVTMIDINERAVQLARDNAIINNMNQIRIMQSDVYDRVADEKFDLIVSNPPIRAGKAVVYRIFEEGARLLSEQGSLWIVIRKQQGAPSTRKKLESLYGQVVEMDRRKGYYVFKASQPFRSPSM